MRYHIVAKDRNRISESSLFSPLSFSLTFFTGARLFIAVLNVAKVVKVGIRRHKLAKRSKGGRLGGFLAAACDSSQVSLGAGDREGERTEK
jgi:hypothetical protein